MNRKLILKYILFCLPFIIGSILFGFGMFNLFSSLLFFCGGYVAVKNIFDYRKIKNNVDSVMVEKNNISRFKEKKMYRSYDNVPGLKRTIRYPKVRKRIKY